MQDITPVYLLLKASLGRASVSQEIELLLRAKCEQALKALQRSGVSPDLSEPADCALIAAYAEWLYKRRNAEDPKPRALIDEIHDRQVSRATGGKA